MLVSSWGEFERAEPEMAEKGRALLYERGDGEGLPGHRGGQRDAANPPAECRRQGRRLLVFVQAHSAKARDLAANPHYALHAHMDPAVRTSSWSGVRRAW